MIFSPVSGLPYLKSYDSIKRRTGSGTVLVDPHSQTLTINTGAEQITAKYLDSNFQSGDLVRYTMLNDMLIIEKMPVPDQTNAIDSYVREHPAESNKISMMLDSLITKISSNYSIDQIKQDFFSIIESLSAESKNTDQKLIQNISTLLLKMENLNSDSTERLKDLLLHLKQNFTNPQSLQPKFIELSLTNIPQVIYKIEAVSDLFNSGQLPESALLHTMNIIKESNCQYLRIIPCGDKTLAKLISSEDLQHELKSLTDSFTSRQLQSLPVSVLETVVKSRNQLNLEVLNSVDELLTNMKSVVSFSRAGTESAQNSTLTQWLITSLDHHSILPELVIRYPATATSIISMMKENPVLSPGIDKFGITAELINSIERKADFIPSVIDQLGFNFDNKLLKSVFFESSQTSMKKFILEKSTSSIMSIPLTSHLPATSSLQLNRSFSELIDNAVEDISELLDNLPDIIKSDPNLKKNLKSIHDSFLNLISIKKNVDEDFLQNQNTDVKNKSLLNLNDSSVNLLSNLLKDIKAFQNSLSLVRGNNSSDLFEHLMNLSEKAGRSIDKLLIENQDISLNHDLAQKRSDQINGSEHRDFMDKKTALDSISIKEGLLQNQQSRTTQDSLLNRFESLQLLSRFNSTNEGIQQILAIPMNVGGEWTELNIRLIKKECNNKKKNQNFYKVELNVAPSKLGAINVRMEYEIKKSFNLTISFDKNQTMQWFSKNRNSLGKSMCDLGLPLVNFLIQSDNMKKSEHENSKLSTAGIDFKI